MRVLSSCRYKGALREEKTARRTQTGERWCEARWRHVHNTRPDKHGDECHWIGNREKVPLESKLITFHVSRGVFTATERISRAHRSEIRASRSLPLLGKQPLMTSVEEIQTDLGVAAERRPSPPAAGGTFASIFQRATAARSYHAWQALFPLPSHSRSKRREHMSKQG